MTPPNLNRKLELEDSISLADGKGGFSKFWYSIGSLWASIDARGGAERLIGGREVSIKKFRVITRAAPFGAASRPRPDQRFREGDRSFDILAVSELDGAAQYLEIWAEEGRI